MKTRWSITAAFVQSKLLFNALQRQIAVDVWKNKIPFVFNMVCLALVLLLIERGLRSVFCLKMGQMVTKGLLAQCNTYSLLWPAIDFRRPISDLRDILMQLWVTSALLGWAWLLDTILFVQNGRDAMLAVQDGWDTILSVQDGRDTTWHYGKDWTAHEWPAVANLQRSRRQRQIMWTKWVSTAAWKGGVHR